MAGARRRHAAERFERAAPAASALGHPNIGTIYDVDEREGLKIRVLRRRVRSR